MSLETELIDVDYFADDFADVGETTDLTPHHNVVLEPPIESHGQQLYHTSDVFPDNAIDEFVSSDCYVELDNAAIASTSAYVHQNPAECCSLTDQPIALEHQTVQTVGYDQHYQEYQTLETIAQPQFHDFASYHVDPSESLIQCHECFGCFEDIVDFHAHIEFCIINALEFAVRNLYHQQTGIVQEAPECSFVYTENEYNEMEPPPMLEQMEPFPLSPESFDHSNSSTSGNFIVATVASKGAPNQFVYNPNIQQTYYEDLSFLDPIIDDFNITTYSPVVPQNPQFQNERMQESQFIDDGACPSNYREVHNREISELGNYFSGFISVQLPSIWKGSDVTRWRFPIRPKRIQQKSKSAVVKQMDADLFVFMDPSTPQVVASSRAAKVPRIERLESLVEEVEESDTIKLTPIDGPILKPSTKMKCPVCKVELYRHNYVVHYRIHSGELPYQCLWCDKRYRTSSGRKIHHRLHTGDRPYKCKYCVYATVTKRNLDRHVHNAHRKELDV
ncbi:hypothetical protein M3Y98_01020500 [Aphelenchoides besseyi]|nr:hypothetical protein M3Y98_01020500 [Aphelenchoides besseyi]KAI6210075.1 hypothetical protein M3Y96_00288800 [Aphelenchoides besseyi]